MGGSGSRHASQSSNAPRTYYLVIGEPKIRYIKSRTRGPLIFDVSVERNEEEEKVEHAETFQLNGAVPVKQDFALTPHETIPNCHWLSFKLSLSHRARRLRIYAGVEVQYVEGTGVRLMEAERCQDPCCVANLRDVSASCTQVTCEKPITLKLLTPATFADSTSGSLSDSKRLTSAPLAIVLELEPQVRTVGPAKGDAVNKDKDSEVLQAVVLYTFLDVPLEALGEESPSAAQGAGDAAAFHSKAAASKAVAHRRGAGAHKDEKSGSLTPACPPAGPIKARAVKQLLQIGTEVYELEDVFDLGVAEEVASGSDGGGELCVICLTNHKDTTILPCRHMCLCFECAAQLRLSNNKCPICRGNIARVMTM